MPGSTPSLANGAARAPLNQLLDSVFRLVKAFKCRNAQDLDGLSRTQLATLAALNERSPRRITSLAEDSRSDLSVLSRQIAALENSGLVTRTRDPNDGRAYLVSLTDQGHQMLAEVWAKRVAELRGNLADFSDEDLAHVVLILERIAASWDGRPKTPTNPLPSLRPTT